MREAVEVREAERALAVLTARARVVAVLLAAAIAGMRAAAEGKGAGGVATAAVGGRGVARGTSYYCP